MKIPRIAVVFNWRNQQNASGLYPIHIRIKIGQQGKYYPVELPKKVSKKEWSGTDDAWVKSSHEFAFEINEKIRERKKIITDLIKRYYMLDKPLDFPIIFKQLNNRGNANSFFTYMKEFIRMPPEKLEDNTIKKYDTTLKHLQSFRKEILFSEIDPSLVKDFSRHMETKLNLLGGTCRKYMESFKRVVRQAAKDNHILPAQLEFLFDDVKIKVNKPKRVWLEPKEIKAWRNVEIPDEQQHLVRDRDLYLFQIYTGYYYKDLQKITKTQLINDDQVGLILIGERDKNANQTIIPLYKFPYAGEIIELYKSKAENDLLFASKFFTEEPVYNRNLKQIAKMASIKKNVTNKVARHTNAQLWIRYGAERPIISKMLGHMKEETTKNYFDVNIPEVIEGTNKVDFDKLGI